MGWSVKLEGNVRLLDQFLGDMDKYEQVAQCVKANQPLHLQESRRNTSKLIHSQFYNPIAAYYFFFFPHPDRTPTLHGGQTWVCMRFCSGRVRSEFCEDDWE